MKSKLATAIGQVLKDSRLAAGKNLRDIEGVAVGHLSNVERAQKNISPELLEAVCTQLDIPVSEVMYKIADYMKEVENGKTPKKYYNYGPESLPGTATAARFDAVGRYARFGSASK